MEMTAQKENVLPVTKGLDLMEILPKILNVDKNTFKMSPSEFVREMSLTTEERQKKLIHTANVYKILENPCPPQFKVVPHFLVFQTFEGRETYSLNLEVKNIGKTLLPLQMHCPMSEFFSARSLGSVVSKIAPGLSAEFEITFTPDEARDYSHYIEFRSKTSIFRVPIAAIGPRALLDIPDQIIVNPGGVKIPISKFLVIRNIGNSPAIFNFISKNEHFQISPQKGILPVHETMLLNITCCSFKIGEVSETVYLMLETGEKLHISLHGSAEKLCIRLEKSTVVHDDTYVGLQRCKAVRLSNNSASVIKFSWKKYKSRKEELEIAESLKEKYTEMAQLEVFKDAKVIHYGLSNAHRHNRSCERIREDEIRIFEKEEFKFSHGTFSILPESGEVWPKTSMELITSFAPKEPGAAFVEAYLEVTGQESRLPLKMKGCGLGPNIVLNIKVLDIDYVYLCSNHKYEVLAENKGDINGTLEYKPGPLIFGGKVEVTPESRFLKAKECAAFVLTFTSNRQGEFTETINFIVKESGDKVDFVFKGRVVCPTLHFDIKELNFGAVPFGFPTVREVTLKNLSVVPVMFSVWVSGDGEVPSLSYEQFAKMRMKPLFPASPKEFKIEPSESVVEAFSSRKVKVTLTPNREGVFSANLMVNMWDSDTSSMYCPVRFCPQIPNLVANPEKIIIPFCFINFPYTRSINIENHSTVDGFFYILPPDLNTDSTTCSASICQGVLEGGGSVKVDLTLITSVLGRQVVPIRMLTFGLQFPQELCTITCVGQGPVLTLNPYLMNWGQLPLLQESSKKLKISNESPIPANVTMYLSSRKSPFSVEPASLNIDPEKSVEVDVSVFLCDPGIFKESLKVMAHNGKSQQVSLSVTGNGNSLTTQPNINPVYNLGTLYSNRKYEFEIHMTNRSSKSYALLWSSNPDPRSVLSENFATKDFPFNITPPKVDIPSKETKTVILEVCGTSPGNFKQTFYCFGSAGAPTKELYLTSEVLAEFVEPLIQIDKSEVFYWYNIGSDKVEAKLQDTITLTNISVLPVTVNLRIAQPFSFQIENEPITYLKDVILEGNSSKEIVIKFGALPHADRRSRVYKDILSVVVKDYSKKIALSLEGEINYPNLIILPKQIDFHNIPLGATAYTEACLVNISPLTSHYKISWNVLTSELVFYEKTASDNLGFQIEDTIEHEEYEGEHLTEEEDVYEMIPHESISTNKTEVSIPPEPSSLKMPEITILKSDIKDALFPIARNYYTCEDELMEAYKMTRSSDTEDAEALPSYTKLCDITPFYGTLDPYASQILAIKFSGNYPVKAHLEALIEVHSGPTEVISIDAKVGEIDFHLSAYELDFGKQLFCETKSETLNLQNTGPLPFFFETRTRNSQMCEFNDDFPLGMGALTVTPHSGDVDSYSIADLIVRYHPGVPGKFEDSFNLQIAYLDPVAVKVKGYGVFPQVYLFLPRPELDYIPAEIGYAAVASLTPDWILAGYFNTCGPRGSFFEKPCGSLESGIDDLSEKEAENEWEFIYYSEIVPSNVDINLAVERTLAFRLVSKNSTNTATFAVYARTIPEFLVPAYELDFGVCVIGRAAERNVTVQNFGPLPVIIYGIFDPSLKHDGISIRLKNRNELKIGASLPFVVGFLPKKKRYKEKCINLETFFYFEIYHGPKIPIKIKAIVTYPHVISSTSNLNFSQTICGRCKIMTLKLKNPGLVTASWCLQFTNKKLSFSSNLAEEGADGRSMFYSNTMSGCLVPGEYCCVQVCFQPKTEGLFSATMVIQVAQGLEEVKVPLLGEAFEPKLTLSQSCLDFGSVLPFSNKIEKSFVITNPCEFPVEFYFPTIDDQIFDEDKILRAVMMYYQKKEILLPIRCPGEGLPLELMTFYQMLLDDLNTKFIEEEQEKALAEKESQYENAIILAGEDDAFNLPSILDKTKKKLKKSISRSQTSVESGRGLSTLFDNTKDPTNQTIFEAKTSQEIDQMLQEHISNIVQKPMFDPLEAALKKDLTPVEEEEYSPGILVIFHGAPFTNCTQWANKIALWARLTPLNIDRIVLEEAAIGRCEAGRTAKDLIEQAYWESAEDEKKEITFEGEETEESDILKQDYTKDFEEIQRKFNILMELRENATYKKKTPTSAKSDTSKKQEKGTPKTKNANAPGVILSEDLILEILKYRFSLELVNGLIIEGLHSLLITSSIKGLEIVLKAAGKVKDIIFILLLSTYEQYSQYMRDKQADEELLKAEVRKELLRIAEEEPEEVFQALDLNPEEAESIRGEYLSQRHESYELFLGKRIKFYEKEKLKTEYRKKGLQVPLLSLQMESDVTDANDKKDKKKDSNKGAKLSDISGRKTGSEAKSVKLQRNSTELLFLTFEKEFEEMKRLTEAWDQRKGGPVVEVIPETKLKKGQTPRKAEPPPVSQVAKNDPGRGVFLWIVNVPNPEHNSVLGVSGELNSIVYAPAPEDSDSWPQETWESTTFGVVPFPPMRVRGCESNTFTVTVCENCALEGEDTYDEASDSVRPSTSAKLNRSQSSISFKSKRRSSATSKRRKTESRTSTEIKSQKSKNLVQDEEYQCKTRCILQPGEKTSYCVRFFPTQTGIWQQTIPINFVTWVNGCAINCIGVCDIPKLDMTPEVVFPRPKPSNTVVDPFETTGYLYSEKAYDFGAVIQRNDEKKSSEKNAVFTFSNPTTLPVDLCVVFAPDANGDEVGTSPHVKFTPDKFYLKPGEKDKMTVTMSPAKVGPVVETLMLLVKDNPKIEIITLKSEGVKPNITVEPEEVNFDRLLLRRKVSYPVLLKNNSNVPLYVSLKGLEEFPQQLSFSETKGWIGSLKSMTIDVEYQATEIQIINQQTVEIKVYETVDAEEPVQELSFNISVEAYDAALDIIFDTKEDDHVNFGDVRVENDCGYVFNLKNQGKYPLGFKMDVDYQILAESQNDNFFVNPAHGIIPPGKCFPLSVSFMARNEVSWKRVPLLKLLLVEPYKGDEMIATIPISVTARSHFAKYEIKPEDHFNFGHIPVGCLKEGSLLIENKGHFSLVYFVEIQTTFNSPEASEDAFKKSSKYTASSKEKGDKGKKNLSVCKVGIFEISPNTGTAESGETAVVNIKCCPEEVKMYEEKIIIFVNESLPHLKQGNPITISAEACLPAIRFEDYKSVFREHFVCKTEEEFNSRVKVGSYTIYTENNNLFSFKNVCVNKTAEARIYLPNASVIECHVTASIASALREDNSRTSISSSGSQCFNISESKLIIEPYNSGSVLLSFRPEALEVYKARLIFTLEMPDNFENVVQTYELWGNGVLPQIEISKPSTKFSEGQILVNFPPTAPGNCSTSLIAITNTGTMDCKVIIELYKFQNGIFTLIPKPDTKKMMKMWDLVKPIDHTAIVSMSPGEIAEFNVIFNPQEVQTYQSQIKLFVVDNPFENWCFKLIGEVVVEEVIIEKVRLSVPFLGEDDNETRFSSSVPYSQNHINFGDCNISKKSKALIRLTNKTEKDYFRFEWEDIPNITISPSAGHLYPRAYKEILVIFQPEEPMEFEEIPVACTLSKISLEFPSEPSWDTRLVQFQKSDPSFSAQSNDKRVSRSSSPQMIADASKISGEEPYYEVASDFNKVIYLSISGVADYAKLNCETTKINFKNTFMFQNRVFPLVLENTGNVNLEYELKLKSVSVRPLRTNKMSQVSEKSLLQLQQNRPQSSFGLPSLSQKTHESQSKSTFLKCDRRPRPLSSASLMDLERSSSECFELRVETSDDQVMTKYNPFVIENVSGQIRSKEKTSCNIAFSPMDINEYKAVIVINVPNLHPECVLPEIEVTASSIMPFCHFSVPESDYLESGRRDHSRPGPIGYPPGMPLDANTKTIEIKVLGIGSTIPVKFYVINPTEEDYTFSWTNITQVQQETVPSFHCTTPEGRIGAGRQQKMIFSFVSQRVGITESFWKFCIPKYEVETPFLFVGDVREASVYLLPNHINLAPTTIGSSSTGDLTMINNEEIDFEFYFLPESFFSEGRLNALKVEPASGKILANSNVNIRVTFTGKTGGKILFNLKCKVTSIREPLSITVQATTYVVQPLLAFEDLKKVKRYPDPSKETLLDFGNELVPNRPETITLSMTSLSKPSFYYEWEYNKKMLDMRFCKLRFTAKNGHVASFSRGTCNITIVFHKKSSLYNFPLKLKIRRGPTFVFVINASACTPLCEFSFDTYDFEYCFLQDKDVCFYETNLIIKNKENSDLVLEASLNDPSAFSYSLSTATIPPGDEINIPISFHPKECIPYSDVIKFTINGVHEKIVNLKGHGTDFKVNLSNPDDTTVSFGAVRIGKTCTRHFTLTNRSLAPATLLLGFSDQLPVHGLYLAKPKENFIDLSEEHRLTGTIKILPSTVFRIKQQEEFKVQVVYTPDYRSAPFSETVCLQFQEKAEPICLLTGCSLGAEISLDRTVLNFGAVVESCSNVMMVKLVNSGNIGARFEWNTADLENYSIYPVSGYCSPESDVTIHVTFSPLAVQNCIKKTVECELFFSDNETYPPLLLNLIGDCIGLPEAEKTIHFECLVRETDQKAIDIDNSTGKDWHLVPLVSGEYFRGVEVLFVPSLSTATYEVNYCPLTMTEHSSFHEGSVFFRLPNGQGILYKLSGTSLPPNPVDVIEREIPCKTKYAELLKVQNWLQYPQRFRVNITRVGCLEDVTCICTGLENLEIPGGAEKEYSLNFFAYNIGIQKFLVTFVNEDTREYVWYDITFNVVMCGPLEVITLKSGVRQTCYHDIKLENPLMRTIFYTFETSAPEIRFEHETYEVPPEGTVFATLSFTPIHSREVTEKLTAYSPDLGVFPRELRLISVDVNPGPPRIFQTPLGSSLTEEFLIKNLSHLNAVLRCRTTSEDFIVNEQTSVPAGQIANIKVTYEPSDLESVTGTLFVESEQAGNFTFPLLGICGKPLAKGPFILKPGSGINIPFKNIFKKTKEFHMFVDNPGFFLKSAQEIIQPKEECKIYVGLQKTKHLEKLSEIKDKGLEPRFPVMGQLVVECFSPYVKWQFYLKGVLEK